MMQKPRLRIIVAMSGGVDSSVAATLLTESGHDVTGVMLRLWSDPSTENLCCTPDSMALARDISSKLGIPFHTLDTKSTFRENVVQYFIDNYKVGKTPNPCVACNRTVRWKALFDIAKDLGATHIATGHYARIQSTKSGKFKLLRGIDEHKDQSYVLFGLTQAQLSATLFPLGTYTKQEIRALAKSYNLPVAERPDSQDLCFVGNQGYRDFLIRNAPEVLETGPIVSLDGQKLGEHLGLAFYTIGQRKGLGITAPQPYYVLSKDIVNNRLVVGFSGDLGRDELTAGDVNWISGEPPKKSFRALVKIRYKARDVWGSIRLLNVDRIHIKFDQPIRDITPGQAAVLYEGEVCLGGGIIE